MQTKFLIAVLAGLASVSATGYGKPSKGYDHSDDGYGHKGYGGDSYEDSDDGYSSGYGRKGYGGDSYEDSDDGYGHSGHGYKPQTYAPPTYEPYHSHYTVDKSSPYPYTYFTSTHKKHDLSLPKLGDYHCFLTGAPWTTCGRKSLTNYFLDQCLVFYVQMSANVNGICGGKPPKPTPEPTAHNDDYYSHDYHSSEPTPKPEPKPTTRKPKHTGYGDDSSDSSDSDLTTDVDASSPAYLQEKCYQSSFVSITTATVMCLTENYIRVNFIEHYAARACGNPIEGPILYLRKLHSFINEVLECTGADAAKNFPNLYRTFKAYDSAAYNPSAPFYLDGDKKVATAQYTSGEASGLAAYTVGSKFLCANTAELDLSVNDDDHHFVYLTVPSTNHYNVAGDDGKFSATNMYTTCGDVSAANNALGHDVLRHCQSSKYTSDRSLRSLYDSVHYVEKISTSLRRPLTIAEIAVRSAGIHEQPILEGFGIMYYCGFYACVANNDGDASKCYPEFDSEKDWKLVSGVSYSDLQTKSREINECIEDGWLTNEDMTSSGKVNLYTEALSRRSYLCQAENDVVDFFTKVFPTWASDNDDAAKWVYGRHLADERCWAAQTVYDDLQAEIHLCPSNADLYQLLQDALADLSSTCAANKVKTAAPEPRSEPSHKHKAPVYGAKPPSYK